MNGESKKILYVEDDEVLAFVTKDNLEFHGYQVVLAVNGREAYQFYLQDKFDICLVDVMLPVMDGFTLAKEIREIDNEIPIIFLTAKSLKEDRIHGLKLGADDYIVKPFSIEELILKIEVFLKRKYIVREQKEMVFNLGTYKFDYLDLLLKKEDFEKRLTQKEADVLLYLYQNRNNIVPRADILKKVWKQNDYFVGRSLDVFISRLRKYLADDESISIENIHGIGFKFVLNG
jgi:DNA-binding response OmpR family regulator